MSTAKPQRSQSSGVEPGPWAIGLSNVERARLRARGRVLLQRLGYSEAELAEKGISLEAVGCVRPPDQWLPHETIEAVALGRALAKEHSW